MKIKLKTQKTIVILVLTALVAAFSFGGQSRHIGLIPEITWYDAALMRTGILAGEFAVLVLGLWHIHRLWIWTRLYCLAAAFIMGGVLVMHSSIMTTYDNARMKNKAELTAMDAGVQGVVKSGTEGITAGAGKAAGAFNEQTVQGRRQARAAVKEGVKGAQNATDKAVESVTKAHLEAEDKAKASVWVSPVYLNGWAYMVNFLAALALLGFGAFLVLEWGAPYEDDDENGTPNFAEVGHRYFDPEKAWDWYTRRGYQPPEAVMNWHAQRQTHRQAYQPQLPSGSQPYVPLPPIGSSSATGTHGSNVVPGNFPQAGTP